MNLVSRAPYVGLYDHVCFIGRRCLPIEDCFRTIHQYSVNLSPSLMGLKLFECPVGGVLYHLFVTRSSDVEHIERAACASGLLVHKRRNGRWFNDESLPYPFNFCAQYALISIPPKGREFYRRKLLQEDDSFKL